jgi:thiamine pyrophosphokinase
MTDDWPGFQDVIMAILIFANGDMEEREWIRPYLSQALVTIAADGGTRHLLALGETPDIIVGDMDSLSAEIEARVATAGSHLIRYPPAKDETDLELALIHAADTFADDILVFGVFGGRLDQALANILLLAHPRLSGRNVYLLAPYQRAWLLSGDAQTEIRGEPGDMVSLLAVAGDATVAATTGLQWPLREEMLLFGLTRGLSNVMTADRATVTLRSGRLLCVHTQRAWGR